jgi:hypothetical protein
VWDDNDKESNIVNIIGYSVVYDEEHASFMDSSCAWWWNAEPIPAWTPKDGETVFYNVGNYLAGIGIYSNGRVYHGNRSFNVEHTMAKIKPFDGDIEKIGKPWRDV